jgi:hypothetical protein
VKDQPGVNCGLRLHHDVIDEGVAV